jgi:hypothetical protein
MPILFRPARVDELQRAQELVVRTINDLTERHGFGPMATLRPPDFQLFCLRVGLNINAHDFRPLPDVEKVRECWRAAATPRHSRWFSRNLWRGVGSG